MMILQLWNLLLKFYNYFNMTKPKANKIMLKIHNDGSAVCGVYPYEVAETKVMEVINFAKQNQYPLKCIMKKSI